MLYHQIHPIAALFILSIRHHTIFSPHDAFYTYICGINLYHCFLLAEVRHTCFYSRWGAPRTRFPLENACSRGLQIVENNIHAILFTISLSQGRILSCSLLVCVLSLFSELPDHSRMQERQLYSAVSIEGSDYSQMCFGGLPTLQGSIAMSRNA